MKKHFLLAALTAALLVSPYADAASGFSRGSSSSSTSSSKTSASAKSESKSNYGSYSGFASSSSKKADTPRVQTYVPTTLPRQAATPPAADPSPARSGFGATAKSGTGKTVAAVATASVLGGAMYSASANHDAVTAYEAKKKADAAQAAPQPAPTTSMASTQDSRGQASVSQSDSHYQPRQQTQVVVVQQSPQYHGGSMLNDAYWYERGRDAARRDEREREYQRDRDYQYAQAQAAQAQAQAQAAQAPAAPAQGGYAPSVPPVAPSVAPATVAQAAPRLKAAPVEQPHHSSHIGLILFLVFLAAAIGGIAYFVLRGSKPGKPAKKANYTL